MQVVCLQHATAALIIPDRTFYQCMERMRRVAPRLRNPSTLIHKFFASTGCFHSSAVSGVEFLGVASGGNRLGSKGAGRYNSPAAESDCKTPTRWPPMSSRRFSRIARGACLAAGLMVSGLAATLGAEVPVQDVVLKGKVLTLAAALDAKKLGIRVDAEPTASTVVLLGEEGTITPLLSDEASRALFLDKRLHNRPAELRGKRFGGVPYLQVVTFKVEQEGKLQTPEYYCNICTISVRFPQVCPCCQGPMELRMKPGR